MPRLISRVFSASDNRGARVARIGDQVGHFRGKRVFQPREMSIRAPVIFMIAKSTDLELIATLVAEGGNVGIMRSPLRASFLPDHENRSHFSLFGCTQSCTQSDAHREGAQFIVNDPSRCWSASPSRPHDRGWRHEVCIFQLRNIPHNLPLRDIAPTDHGSAELLKVHAH